MSYIKYPEAVKFYKKKSELQVKLAKPEADAQGKIVKKGCVFFEMANAIPGNEEGRIDWDNKIIMKIGTNDIAQILYGLRTRQKEITLIHTTDTAKSQCFIKEGNEGSYGVQIRKTIGTEVKSSQLYLSGPDMVVLSSLLSSALTATLGWA